MPVCFVEIDAQSDSFSTAPVEVYRRTENNVGESINQFDACIMPLVDSPCEFGRNCPEGWYSLQAQAPRLLEVVS